MSNFIRFLFVTLLFSSFAAHAYSYAEAEDPMTAVFKDGVKAVQTSNWGDVSSQVAKGMSLQKGHLFEANYLQADFDQAIQKKNDSRAIELFANLVYVSIREKMHRVTKNFADIKANKSRLALARKSYLDILDGNVKKQDSTKSKEILSQFSVALTALGNPGLFGIGARAPDPTAYQKAVKMIETLIIASFPKFT